MLIRSYGLFWRRSEVDWNPGKGKKNEFRLLGRQGTNLPGLKLADIRKQQGIYVLYGDYGPHYVGLTRDQGLGKRLKDHLTDQHANKWDRFSWFGFCVPLKPRGKDPLWTFKPLANKSAGSPRDSIADMEALLMKAMGLSNIADMNFKKGSPWIQVERDEASYYLDKAVL